VAEGQCGSRLIDAMEVDVGLTVRSLDFEHRIAVHLFTEISS
jgi:hypothetical protein